MVLFFFVVSRVSTARVVLCCVRTILEFWNEGLGWALYVLILPQFQLHRSNTGLLLSLESQCP